MDPIMFPAIGDPAALVSLVGQRLAGLGFTVVPGPDGWSGQAEVGNAAARVLAGGFVRRMKVGFAITQGYGPGEWLITITPLMTGASGGLLGMSKAKKEMAAISGDIGGALQYHGVLLPPR